MTRTDTMARLAGIEPGGFSEDTANLVLERIVAAPRTQSDRQLETTRRGHRGLWLTAVAAVVIAGGAMLGFTLLGQRTPHHLRATLVVDRTRIAVASASNEIEHLQVTNTATDTGNTNSSSDNWYYGSYGLFQYFNAGGSPLMTWADTPSSTTVFDYTTKEFWQQPPRLCAATASGCGRGFPSSPGGAGYPPVTQVEQEIANGTFTVSGPTDIDGRQALDLTRSDNGVTMNIWVDPTTYLPFKAAWTWSWRMQVTLISWLAPTNANMAVFSPSPPAGFTAVAEPTAPAGCPGTPGGGTGRPNAECRAALGTNSGR